MLLLVPHTTLFENSCHSSFQCVTVFSPLNPLPTIVICSVVCLLCTFVPYIANNMDSTRSDFSHRSSMISRVCTDLEMSFNLTLVLENSWNLKIGPFFLELSWNFAKLPLKTWVGPGKLKTTTILTIYGISPQN